MVIVKQAADLQKHLQKLRIADHTVGFVPTMGALHKGHLSLLNKSREIAGYTVCSIFVNPTQFNNPEDFNNYPVTVENDIYLLERAGCNMLFLPDVKEIYPGSAQTGELFSLGYLENILEGKYRPGHFQGVCMVVKRLLGIVSPTFLLAGQKDYQQCLVLQKLLHNTRSAVRLIIAETQREPGGLAMSSRNLRLNKEERIKAAWIYDTLCFIKENISRGNLRELKKLATDRLKSRDFKVDYVEIANVDNLQSLDDWDGSEPIIILIAAHLNNVRLIDNLKY